MRKLLTRPLVFLIRVYQLVLSPWLGGNCRFYPTCSAYAGEALARHGVLRGGYLALRRIGRCHPCGGSGVDPVPPSPLSPSPLSLSPSPPSPSPPPSPAPAGLRQNPRQNPRHV